MLFKEYIEEQGLKTSFVCKKLGVTRQTIHRILVGCSISPELANRIHEKFGEKIHVEVSNSCANHIRRRKI